MNSIKHDDAMAKVFRDDSAFAVLALNKVLKDGDQEELAQLLYQLSKASDGIVTSTRRVASPQARAVQSLSSMLRGVGLQLSVTPIHSYICAQRDLR